MERFRQQLNIWIMEANVPNWLRRAMAVVEWHIGGREARWGK